MLSFISIFFLIHLVDILSPCVYSPSNLPGPVVKIRTNFYACLVFVLILYFISTSDAVTGSEKFVGLYSALILNLLADSASSQTTSFDYNSGVNQFTDLTPEEFRTRHTCYKAPSEYLGSCRPVTSQTRNQDEVLKIPAQFDWRDKNVVTIVKNQGLACGSCWAFSTIANVESINAMKTGQLIELSEQQLVDCDNEDKGCEGGLPKSALEYMSKGAMSSASYPYDAVQANCRYNERDVAVKVKDCVAVNGTEDFIAEQLVAIGPLSIDNGMPYWLMKNSYGVNIKENGYFRMQKGVNCLGFTTYQPPVSAVV